MGQARSARAINQQEKTRIRNLHYGPGDIIKAENNQGGPEKKSFFLNGQVFFECVIRQNIMMARA